MTPDPYILGLAVACTPCFGYHERGNPTCGECPVSARCVESRAMRAVTVANQLEKAARAAARAAKSPYRTERVSPVPAQVPAGVESIDDILDSISRAPAAPVPDPEPVAAPGPVDDLTSLFGDILTPEPVQSPPPPPEPTPGDRVTPMKAVIDSVCFVCGGRIPAKSSAEFIPGKGLRHPACP